uniref:Uncharacterized protein n=1 Tax=Pyrodinium bahamense TaxID=73915 RepID=A0A7S0FK16_9DINO
MGAGSSNNARSTEGHTRRLAREEACGQQQQHRHTRLTDLPATVLSERVAPLLEPEELAGICCSQAAWAHEAALLVSEFAVSRHGTKPRQVTRFADLWRLEAVASTGTLNFSSPDFLLESGAELLRGSSFEFPIYVGRAIDKVTTAVNPPACGDTFEVPMQLQRGRYLVSVSGWCNPYHGILDLMLDGVLVSGPEGLDWCGEQTEHRCFAPFAVEVEWTGSHRWRFTTSRKNEKSGKGFWLCLQWLQVDPVDPVHRLGAFRRAQHCGSTPPQVSKRFGLLQWASVRLVFRKALNWMWGSLRGWHLLARLLGAGLPYEPAAA